MPTTRHQIEVLRVISRMVKSQGRGIGIRELARALEVSPHTVYQTLNRMERNGLIHKRPRYSPYSIRPTGICPACGSPT